MAATCGINPVTVVAVTESQMCPSHKATRVFLPWFTQSDLIPKVKYLHLKFGFQCASLLAAFNNILEDYRPEVVSATLPTADKHLFTLTFAPSVCMSAEETRQSLNEWEFTFLTILCNAIYNARKISAVFPTLQVPIMILNDAVLMHGLPLEQDALTAHILFEWWCSALMTLTEKLTCLQCTFTGIGLSHTYYIALNLMAIFSTISHHPPVSAHPQPPHHSPRQPRLATGRVWLLTEVSLWAPVSQHKLFYVNSLRKGNKSTRIGKIWRKLPVHILVFWLTLPHQLMQQLPR